MGTPENPLPAPIDDDESGNDLLGDRTEAMVAPPADFLANVNHYLDAEELAPDEVMLDDADAEEVSDEVDVMEDAPPEAQSLGEGAAGESGADAIETARPPATASRAGDDASAADTQEQDISTLKTTVDEVLARLAEEDAAAAAAAAHAPAPKPPPVSVHTTQRMVESPKPPPVSVHTTQRMVESPKPPPVAAPSAQRRTDPPVPPSFGERRTEPPAAPAGPRRTDPPQPPPMVVRSATPPVDTSQGVAVAPPAELATPPSTGSPRSAGAVLTPRMQPLPSEPPPAAPSADAAARPPGDHDWGAPREVRSSAPQELPRTTVPMRQELPRTTMPMLPRPPRPSPVPLPPADETTPTGRLALPPPRLPSVKGRMDADAPPPSLPVPAPPPAVPAPPLAVPAPPPVAANHGVAVVPRAPGAAAPAGAPAASEPVPRREGTDPMMRVAPPEAAPPSEPTGQIRREGTDPMMRIAAQPVAARRREGTDPMMRLPAVAVEEPLPEAPPRRREGTDPMMRVPEPQTPRVAPELQTPRIALEQPTPRVAPAPLIAASDPSGAMTGAFSIAAMPEQVLPFRARTGTIPPERPQANDLSGVLPFRPAGWGQPPLPQNLGEPDSSGRLTPADPIPAARQDPPYVPPAQLAPAAMAAAPAAQQGHAAPQGHGAQQGHAAPQGHPPPNMGYAAQQGHAAPQGHPPPNAGYAAFPPGQQAHTAPNAGYAPVPVAPLAAVESPSTVGLRRDHLGTGPVAMGAMHEALPFHAGAQHAAAAPAATPSYPAPPPGAASYPPVPQPLASIAHAQPSYAQQQASQAPAPQAHAPAPPPPAGPPPRPASLPSDSWKLAPSPVLFPLAPPTAAQAVQAFQERAQANARGAGPQQAQPMASQPAQGYAQQPQGGLSYAQQAAEQSVPVPASLGQNAPRLTLEQYACMAAELAVAPGNAAQVRLRYGLDDTSHLAEQGSWQRRFSLDSQLFASYSSLFQHYRDWLNQNGRR